LLPTDGCAPEVTKARQVASERQKNAKNIKAAFLKKLNRAFISSLRLYADNLLCMDLCGWSSVEARNLLGEQVSIYTLPVLIVTGSPSVRPHLHYRR
jgi:hypothetical protein